MTRVRVTPEMRRQRQLHSSIVGVQPNTATDLDRVRDVLRRAFRENRAIAVASEPPEVGRCSTLQLVTWNE